MHDKRSQKEPNEKCNDVPGPTGKDVSQHGSKMHGSKSILGGLLAHAAAELLADRLLRNQCWETGQILSHEALPGVGWAPVGPALHSCSMTSGWLPAPSTHAIRRAHLSLGCDVSRRIPQSAGTPETTALQARNQSSWPRAFRRCIGHSLSRSSCRRAAVCRFVERHRTQPCGVRPPQPAFVLCTDGAN